MTLPQKPQLRQTLLQLRQNLSEEEIYQKSQSICRQIAGLEVFDKAQNILSYYPHNKEVDLLPLIDQHPEKTWHLPQLTSGNEFIALPFTSLNELQKNRFGIPEPIKKTGERYEDQLDLILIPGVAFDPKGNRLGMGKGYYDRYLKTVPQAFKVGVAFSEQLLDQIPVEAHDEPVDLLITELKS